jgi:predicted Zn-dependent protease
MAHEIGHVVQRHIARAYIAQRGSSLTALAGLLGAVLIGAVTGSADAGMGSWRCRRAPPCSSRSTSRAWKNPRPIASASLLADSGFDPNGMAGFFSIIMRERGNELDEIPSLLLTHPLDQVRIGEARQGRLHDASSTATGFGKLSVHRERVRVLARPATPTCAATMKPCAATTPAIRRWSTARRWPR